MEAWFCYYAVMKLRWKPSDYLNMSYQEKLIFQVFVEKYLEAEKEEQRKLKHSASPARRSKRH